MKKIYIGEKVMYHGRKVIVQGINENTREATIVGEHENPYVDIGKVVKVDELKEGADDSH